MADAFLRGADEPKRISLPPPVRPHSRLASQSRPPADQPGIMRSMQPSSDARRMVLDKPHQLAANLIAEVDVSIELEDGEAPTPFEKPGRAGSARSRRRVRITIGVAPRSSMVEMAARILSAIARCISFVERQIAAIHRGRMSRPQIADLQDRKS